MSQALLEEKTEYLRASVIFEKLDDLTMNRMLTGSGIRAFSKGTVLFHQGDLPAFLYLVLAGGIELYATDGGGNETIVEIMEGPDAYMLASVLTMAPYLASGRMVRDGRVLMLREDLVRSGVSSSIDLSHNMLGLLSKQFRTMVRQVTSLKLQSTVERLAHYLLTLRHQQGTATELLLPYDKQRIAVRLGMTPVSLSRAFSHLVELQVDVRGNHVSIGDPERLMRFCRYDALLEARDENLRFVPVD